MTPIIFRPLLVGIKILYSRLSRKEAITGKICLRAYLYTKFGNKNATIGKQNDSFLFFTKHKRDPLGQEVGPLHVGHNAAVKIIGINGTWKGPVYWCKDMNLVVSTLDQNGMHYNLKLWWSRETVEETS